MADASDIEIKLGALFEGVLYPNGIDQPSVVNNDVLIMRGWPNEPALKDALKQSRALVSIYGKDGSEKVLAQGPMKWIEDKLNNLPPSLTVSVASNVATFGGDCSRLPLNIHVHTPEGPVSVIGADGDTPATIAAKVATAVQGANASGSAVTFPREYDVAIGTNGYCIREVRNMEKRFQVTVWALTPVLRDSIASAVDTFMAGVTRFQLPDSSYAAVDYVGSLSSDTKQSAGLYQRVLMYSVRYAVCERKLFFDVCTFSRDITKLGV